MKKTLIILSFLTLITFNAEASNKVDPFIFAIKSTFSTGKAMSPSKNSVETTVNQKVDIFISSNDVQKTSDFIIGSGGKVLLKLKSIITAIVPNDLIEDLSELPEVNYIEAGRPITPKNNDATFDINSTEVNNGTSLPAKYEGSGVIIGLVDTGIDYKHPAFKNRDGENRILYIWDQTVSGRGPSEISGSYGSECSFETIQDETCNLRDSEGHGTHVAGTAAGLDEKYTGVAPNANIVAVTYKSEIEINEGTINPIFSTTICEAVYYIFAKAKKLNKPAVVNLSLGTHIGPHDGTSLFEKCLEEIVSDSTGRAIVAATGNEFAESEKFASIHAGGKINGEAVMPFEIREPAYSSLFYMDLWCKGSTDLSFALGKYISPSKSPFIGQYVKLGEEESGTLSDGLGQYTIDARETENPNNGKSHIGIMIYPNDNRIKDTTLLLSILGNGECDGWWYPDKPSNIVNFFSTEPDGLKNVIIGNGSKTITSPATSPAVIAVGAYTTKVNWDSETDEYEVPYKVGDIMSFSSAGPSASPEETGIKPDLTAPGGMIISARSRDSKFSSSNVVDDLHVVMAGTSMASPFVTGTIALMLEAVPNLTYQDIRKYLTMAADSDEFTGEVPNNRWGYGKLNTYSAVLMAINGGGSGNFDINDLENPASEGGCNIAVQNKNRPLFLTYLMISIIFLFGLRKRLS